MEISSNVKPALWGAVGGAIALAIVGFTWGGWVTNSTATTMAQDHAHVEIAKVLAPICFLQFQQQPDAMAKMVDSRQIIPVIDKTFSFAEAEHALRRMDKSEQFGKIILQIS